MNELIHIVKTTIDGAEINSVNLRDLWEKLESKSEFANFAKKNLNLFDEGVDYITFDKKIKTATGGALLKEYAVTIDVAKHVSMLQRNEKGKEVRTYFIEREKESNVPQLPTNYISALEKLLETEKEKNQLSIENKSQAKIIIMQKKELNEVNVQYARRGEMINAIMMSDNLYKATHLGNRFGISAVLFNRIMKDAKVIRKVSGVWTLTSKYTGISEPYAVLREERKAHSPEEETVMSFAWTSKGVNWVDQNWDLALGRMSDETRKAYEKATLDEEPTIPKKR